MSTLFIQSGHTDLQAPNIAFVEKQVEWLANVIDTRLKLYFGHDASYASIEDVADEENEWYGNFFQKQSLRRGRHPAR